jgi:hypothetical protein
VLSEGPPAGPREARVRPECAWRYPDFHRKCWYLGSYVAEVLGRRPLARHFEFRGSGPSRPAGARTRSTDRGDIARS